MKSFYILESEFDNYQKKVSHRVIDKSFIVKGCIDNKMSILALYKVKQILEDENRGSFYFIVPTLLLNQFMKIEAKEIGIDIKSFTTIKTYKIYTTIQQEVDYIFLYLPFNCLLEDDVKLLQSRAKEGLFIYGDNCYLYNDKKYLSMEEIAVLTKFPMEQLMFNHRLPKKIARFAEYLESTGDSLEERCKNEGSELPKILKYDNLNKQLDAIIDIIKTRGYDDVGIFFPKNSDVEHAYNYFNNNGLNVEAKYNRFMNLDFSTNLPKLTTYHSSKGLQFEAVFLPDCKDIQEKDKNALYVALTRSYQDLFIMFSDNLTSFFNDIPEDLYETSLVTEDIDW